MSLAPATDSIHISSYPEPYSEHDIPITAAAEASSVAIAVASPAAKPAAKPADNSVHV